MTDAFLLAQCPTCTEEVLLSWALVDDQLVSVCVHCDCPIESTGAREVDVDELVAEGYPVEGARSAHGERGCRDGQCGVRQPDR